MPIRLSCQETGVVIAPGTNGSQTMHTADAVSSSLQQAMLAAAASRSDDR
jgi:hypothetical protein